MLDEKREWNWIRENQISVHEKTDLVVMSHVSNVTGYILPVEEIAASAKEYEALEAVDGAQALDWFYFA